MDPTPTVQYLVVLVNDANYPGDKEKPSIIPMSCYVRGEDAAATIRYPSKLNKAVKKDVLAYQKVLFCGEAPPADWPEYQAHIVHCAFTIEDAFAVAGRMETVAAANSNVLFDVPNENGSDFQAIVTEALTPDLPLVADGDGSSTSLVGLKGVLETVSGQLHDVNKKVNDNAVRSTDVAEQMQNLLEVMNNRENLAVSLLTIQDLNATFGCTFPLDDMEKFMQFLTVLNESEEKQATLLEFFANRLCKKSTINQTMAAILKKFMEPKVMRECTSTKKSGNKLILCSTKFYKILEGPMRTLYKNNDGTLLDAESVEKSVGGAINNSTAWTNGSRAVKRKRQPDNHEENNV
ncbi:hypothetical protein QAD02_012390 [Eretmocerus hayati]|uniref:Uncharacterized protein n=1 Tax=Eretmocerus hayati TaxID=131215 RepID=A0ACC2P0F6_9HYME|nr:hypothetical protein QAD02_012390 [Eretmocerus hayati]